jgi:FixJ family two-component response regulator
VDDEPHVLEGLTRTLGLDFDVYTAMSGAAGLQTIEEKGPFFAVISDMRMPVMDGATFLKEVCERAPDTQRILLTGHADTSAAIAAVNEGRILRFLTKPCPADQLRNVLDFAAAQYDLVRNERDLLENTVRGAVRVLAQLMSIVNPLAFGRSTAIARLVKHMAAEMKVADPWIYETAALLSQLGCLIVPAEIISKSRAMVPLSPQESQIFNAHPATAAELLANIPRLETITEIITRQQSGAKQKPVQLRDTVGLGAEMLRLAIDVDRLFATGKSVIDAILAVRATGDYPVWLLEALAMIEPPEDVWLERSLPVRELTEGMILAKDARAKNGLLLVARGQELTATALRALQGFSRNGQLTEPIAVKQKAGRKI